MYTDARAGSTLGQLRLCQGQQSAPDPVKFDRLLTSLPYHLLSRARWTVQAKV